MTSIHGPSKTHNPQDPIEQFMKHLRENQEEYWIAGMGVLGGLFLARGLGWRRQPKINEAAIVTKWMEQTAMSGFNIYALTNEQKSLWESVWRYAEAQQQRLDWPLNRVVAQMIKDYNDVRGYGPGLQAIS